jgi:hypothetical protein
MQMISLIKLYSQAYLTLGLPGARPPDAYTGGGGW